MKNNIQQVDPSSLNSKQERKQILEIATIIEKTESNLGSQMSITNGKHRQQQANIFSEVQKSGLMADELGNVNFNQIHEFTQAWKTQSNFSILLIEKLSLIVNNYFKMLSEMGQRNQEIQILIIYNKSLIEILNKFEAHEKKMIQRIKVLEDFNMKIMKELCALKKRQFDPPQIKTQQSLFARFSLRNLKYQPPKLEEQKPDQKYQQKIEQLFKQYLLEKTDHYIPVVEAKLKSLQVSYKEKQELTPQNLKLQSNIEEVQQLLRNIIYYNKELDNVSSENMFDLYELKWQIRNQMKLLNLEMKDNNEGAEKMQKMFVNDVKKIYAGLTSMNEGELQNYLQKEKQIRKKMKKQRVREQEIFLRACEEAQNQNIELKEDIKKLKERVVHAEDELHNTRAQIQIKNIREKRSNKSYLALDQSSLVEGDMRSSHKRKTKENYQKLSKIVEDMELQKMMHEKQREMMVSNLRQHQIVVQQNVNCNQMMNLVLANYDKLKLDLEQKKLNALLQIPVDDDLQSKLLKMTQEVDDLRTENSKRQTNYIKEISTKNQRIQKINKQLQEARQREKKLNQMIKQLEFFQKAAEKLAQQISKEMEVLVHEDFTAENFLLIMDKMFANFQDCIDEYKRETKKQDQFKLIGHYGQFQNQQNLLNEDKMKKNKLDEKKGKGVQNKEIQQQISSISFKSSKKNDEQKQFKQKAKQKESPQRTFLVKKQLSIPHFNSNKQKFLPESALNESLPTCHNVEKMLNSSQIKDSIIFKSNQNSQNQKQIVKQEASNKVIKKMKTQDGFEQKIQIQKIQQSQEKQKIQKPLKKKIQKEQKVWNSQKNQKLENIQKKEKRPRQQVRQSNKNEEPDKSKVKQKISKEIEKQGLKSQAEIKIKKQQKLEIKRGKQGFQIKIQSSLPKQLQKSVKSQQIKDQNPRSFTKEQQQSERGKSYKSSSQNTNYKMAENQKKNMKVSQQKSPRDPYFLKLNGLVNPNPLFSSNHSSVKQRQSQQNSGTKFHPSSFLTLSDKNKGEQNSFIEKSEKNSQNAEKSRTLSKPHINSVNFTLSEDQLQEELGIANHGPSAEKKNNKKTSSQIQQINKSAIDIGIEMMLVDKMFEKFQRLQHDEDVLDFYELFQRYKQALKCLQKCQQLNKLHQIRYQKFIESIKNKQKVDPSFSLETRLHFLQRHVLEQQEQLLQQKNQFENVFIQHIIDSEKAINEHFNLMRKQNQVKRKVRL